MQGRIQDIQVEGGAKDCGAHQDHQARSPLTIGVQGPYAGPGSSSVLEAFSCYLSLILKHSVTKGDKKVTVDQNLEGAPAFCAPARWMRHCQ